jgi:copper(I)-binding protein
MIRPLVFIGLIFCALPAAAANLLITEAWIKNLPPVVPVRAGYMNITNNQLQTVAIEWLSSESFARIEIHRSIEKNGVMSMQPVPVLTIEPNQRLQLAPGGYHLMMMNPVKNLQPGNTVKVTIGYADKSTQSIEMIVRK